ncbi:MAG: efflux RND transporter permease subunit [Brevinemataceae bacterium]
MYGEFIIKKFIYFFSDNLKITNILLITILILGITVNFLLKREVTPFVEAHAVHINIYSPGLSAQDIEQDVIAVFEEEIQGFEIKTSYHSFANDSYGKIMISLPVNKNLRESRENLIQLLKHTPNIPEHTRIKITEEGGNSLPMYYFTLSLKDSTNQSLLQQYASQINKEIKKISEISDTEVGGLLSKEVHINVDPKNIKKLYISFYEIVKAIRNRNINTMSGTIETDQEEKLLITDASFKNSLDITNTIIRSNFEKKSILLKDVANITEGFETAPYDVYINGKPGVFFGIKAKHNTDISKLTKKIDTYINQTKKLLPKELELTVVNKRADSINEILDLTLYSILGNICIVFLILLIFLDRRTAFWTTMSILISIATVLIVMYLSGITMNIITLAGIITVLGMLVDHGIIISENIYHYKEQGYKPQKAVILGIQEVFFPILITVATTIAAFLPLLLIKDTIGDLIKPLPIVICLALIFSFLDAVLFLPVHLMHTDIKKAHLEKPWIEKLKNYYGTFLQHVLKNRSLVLGIFITIFIATSILAVKMFKGFILLEPIGVGSIYINLEAKGGISRQEMYQYVTQIKSIVEKSIPANERSAIKEDIGKYHILSFSSKGFSPNRGQISVYLTPMSNRTRTFDQILDVVQKDIDASPYKTNFTRIFYDSFGLVPKTANALNIRFLQKSFSDSLNYIDAMKEVYNYVLGLEGVINPEHSALSGKKKLLINFNYEQMARLGLDVHTVSETLKIAANGLNTSLWRSYTEKIPYIVRLTPDSKNDINQIRNIDIPNFFSSLIPLKEIAEINEIEGSADILRSLGERMTEIYIDIDPKLTTPTLIEKQILDFYATIQQKYTDVTLQLEGESKSISNAFADLKISFFISLIIIYVILFILFKNSLQPFIVLLAIPFGMIGSIWAFYFHGQVLSFMSLIGIVGLSGVVVNDAVVMVDMINQTIKKDAHNKPSQTEIINMITIGAKHRFKAVILTTLTTVLGLLPSIYTLKGSANLIIPTITAMAYGLLFATFQTLLLIPVLYLTGMDIQTLFKNNNKEKPIT